MVIPSLIDKIDKITFTDNTRGAKMALGREPYVRI